MSILISAPIRTGKTLFAIKKIFEELNRGRMVYTNIIGIKIEGVISVSSTIDEPFDWRDLPNGSVLVWDECHEHPAFASDDLLKNLKIDETEFDQRKEKIHQSNLSATDKKLALTTVERQIKKAIDKKREDILDIGRAMLLHGHFGIEIYLLTQRVNKLNSDVLGSVVNHYILRRKFGMDAAKIWEFGEAMTSWSKSTADIALNKFLWRYPKHLYKFYVSSESHNVRKTFPYKYLAFLLIPLVLIISMFKDMNKTGFFGLFPKAQETQQAQQKPTEQTLKGENTITTITTDQNGVKHIIVKDNVQNPQNVTSDNQQLDCRKGENINTEQCKDFYNQMTNNNASFTTSSTGTMQVKYNPAKPYELQQIQDQLTYDVKQKPMFAGCMKKGNQYIAYTQQGTIMHEVSQNDCKRLIQDNDRPFNYFKDNEQPLQATVTPASVATETKDQLKQVVVLGNTPTFPKD